MGRTTFIAAALVALALCASSASAKTTAVRRGAALQAEVTITASDNTSLACGVVVPPGPAPAGGWPGIIMFHGLGQSHLDMEGIAAAAFAPYGFASLACDARGTGNSGGKWGLDGATEAQDAQDEFTWFTTTGATDYGVSTTQIGAFGVSLGGGAVWDAAFHNVPFKALVPVITWTSLSAALNPNGVVKTGQVGILANVIPPANWSPELLSEATDLSEGNVTDAVKATEAARTWRSQLSSLKTPTLLIQGRHDFLFDIDQAIYAYKHLGGPKKLYIGDLGHAPAPNPVAEQPYWLGQAIGWFGKYLTGAGTPGSGVEIAHDPWDGSTTTYTGLPKTKAGIALFPGKKTLSATSSVSRSVKLTGGPIETFGDSYVVVSYSGAKNWTHLVATLSIQGGKAPVTIGGALITKSSGVIKIPLLDEAVRLARGKKLTVTLGAMSKDNFDPNPQGPVVPSYATPEPNGATIKIGPVGLALSYLKKTISH